MNYLLNNYSERRKMIEGGRKAVEEMRGALSRTLQALDPYIHPLIVQARLGSSGNGNGS